MAVTLSYTLAVFIILLELFLATFGTGCSLCPSGWSTYGNHCYLFVETKMEYNAAENHCYSLSYKNRKSHLTSVLDTDESLFVANLVTSRSSATTVWIGYDDIEVEGTFVWKDGSTSTWANWRGGQPDNHRGAEDCVHMQLNTESRGWNDLPCTGKLPFVCKMIKRGNWTWNWRS